MSAANNDLIRRRITAILDDMLKTTLTLRERGLDAVDPEDRECIRTLKRIISKAYETGSSAI